MAGMLEAVIIDRLSLKSPALPTIQETDMHDFQITSSPASNMTLTKLSIRTVEAVAAAKIYLETRYSSILSNGSNPLTDRKDSVEPFVPEPQSGLDNSMEDQVDFIQHKSDNMRLFRVLKTKRRWKLNQPREVGDYEVLRLLGKGSFGLVQLVRRKDLDSPLSVPGMLAMTSGMNGFSSRRSSRIIDYVNEVFAMKVIRKADMLKKSQEGHLKAERDFLVASERSRWVVPLIESFQDDDNLYLVMEYMVGGDFLGFLLRYEILSEEMTRFYIAEIILCIEEVHRMKWIHRDVKPDNFLICNSGHLKISDFGLAFDGHWCHNQKYFMETRYSILDKLGIELIGDAQDIAEAQAVAVAEGISGNRPKATYKDDTIRPEGQPVLDHLNLMWKRKMARTIVGTSQYMAPEVIRGESYDGRCD
jgi:protein-serine/threonine kinase